MKKIKMLGAMAVASISVGSAIYMYMKTHPIKTQMLVADAKNMMKDLG